MDDFTNVLKTVTSSAAQLNVEACDIQEILQRVNSSNTTNNNNNPVTSSSLQSFQTRKEGRGGKEDERNADYKMMTDSSSQTNLTPSSLSFPQISTFLPPTKTDIKVSATTESLSATREIEEQKRSEELDMDNASATFLCQNTRHTQKKGEEEDGFQQHLAVLQELDRQIASLNSQLTSKQNETTTPFQLPPDSPIPSGNNNNVQPPLFLPSNTASIISFNSSMELSANNPSNFDRLGHKVEMVYSLLSMLSSNDKLETSRTLLLMSRAADTSELMRQSGCVSHLIQLLHPGEIWSNPPTKEDIDILSQAAEALHHLVQNQVDDKRKKQELRVLKLLDQIRHCFFKSYTLSLRLFLFSVLPFSETMNGSDVCPLVVSLMRLSFDEHHRKATIQLGGLLALAEMLISDELCFKEKRPESSLGIRRYAGMALTNLTYGDVQSKHTLCSFPRFLFTVNAQINSGIEDLVQVFSSVVRNLSWKADSHSKKFLREADCVGALMKSGMKAEKESTLKSILSALWNLSAHCTENKVQLCSIPGALAFLLSTLSSNQNTVHTTSIVENGGGILRNISSHIAVNEEYRRILRERGCFQVLLRHLRSSSLTIVSNACGTLWNLSARSFVDQRTLWDLGAVPMLRSLIHSKHKNIALGSAAALKNLLSARTGDMVVGNLMQERKLRALESELEEHLAEVCEKSGDHAISSPDHHPSRRMSPGAQTMHMMGDLVQKVNPPSPERRMHAHSLPPETSCGFEENNSLIQIPQSYSQQNLERSQASSVSKEEKIQQDKAAVHRYHNSLRKARRKLNQDFSTVGGVDSEGKDQLKNYANVFTEGGKHQHQEEDTPKSFCMEGTPLMSKAGSKSDLSMEKDKGNNTQSKKQVVLSKSASLTRLNNEESEIRHGDQTHQSAAASNVVSPTFSRQSSVQSLESCDLKSIKSGIPSVYSTQVPTGMVSPSDLPDSPSPASPVPEGRVQNIPECRVDEDKVEKGEDSISHEEQMPFATEGSSRMSGASSLSALTIDSETKIKTSAPVHELLFSNEEPEYATFDRGREKKVLEESILSAVPQPKQHRHQRIPPPHPSLSQDENKNCLKGETEDTPKTFKYEGEGNLRNLNKEHTSCSGFSSVSASSSRAEPAVADNIQDVIKSAMPKPKPKHAFKGKQGKAVAIAKPMIRKPHASSKEPRNDSSPIKNTEIADNEKSKNNAADVSLDNCINLAMPKPKSKGERCRRPSLQNKQESDGGKSQVPSPSPKKFSHQLDMVKGKMEGSCTSNTDSYLMKCSNATDLNDVMPPEGLMDVSVASVSLMRNSATSEKVKDASELISEFQKSNLPPPPPLVGKSISEGSESLSEDNYSRIDEDENFDISLEDVDLNLIEEDAAELAVRLEAGEVKDLLTSGDLLIECETLSLVSTESMITNDVESDAGSNDGNSLSTKEDQTKVVKGGGGGSRSKKLSSPFPKMAVRTTKTAQLRAKRASESSNEGKQSASKLLQGQQHKPDQERVKTEKKAMPYSGKRVVSKVVPPPVPPKPRSVLPKKGKTTNNKESADKVSSSPTAARISPFNYKSSDQCTVKSGNESRKEDSENKEKRNTVTGSSKRMLVTTV